MIDFIISLFLISLGYIFVFSVFSVIKSYNPLFNQLIFCQTCFTFASTFLSLLTFYFLTGIQLLPLSFLMGLTFTGIVYKINFETDKLKKYKENIDITYSHNFQSFWKELFYTTRLFWLELIFLNAGLIIIKYGGL